MTPISGFARATTSASRRSQVCGRGSGAEGYPEGFYKGSFCTFAVSIRGVPRDERSAVLLGCLRVDRGRFQRGVPEHRGDGGKRHPGGDRGDAVAVAQAPGTGLEAFDARRTHERAHLAVRGLTGDGLQGARARPGARLGAAHAVHGNDPPVLSAALERRDPQLRGLEVDVARPQRQRLAHAAAAERECAGKGLHRRLAVGPDRGEKARAAPRP